MKRGSLEDPNAKLQRAAKQLIELRMEASTDGLRLEFFAEEGPPLPVNLPLMLGDAYYNARAVLDYLVYQLHERHYRGKIPHNVAVKTAFPIYSQAPQGDLNQSPSIGHLSKRERTAIIWLQPYRQRNDSLYGVRAHLDNISKINNFEQAS